MIWGEYIFRKNTCHEYKKVLQVSAAQVYLTYPFVLSWSFLEAMASGCLLIGSKAPPVTEVLNHSNGLELGFFDVSGLSEIMLESLEGSNNNCARKGALRTVRQYCMEDGLVGYESII